MEAANDRHMALERRTCMQKMRDENTALPFVGRTLRLAMLSLHSHPLGHLGASTTGGMSVYVLELARWLGNNGHAVDIFTAAAGPDAEPVKELWPRVRLVSLAATMGSFGKQPGTDFDPQRCAAAIEQFALGNGGPYSLIHSNYWIAGRVGELLAAKWRCPHLITFHTLAVAKQATDPGHRELALRVETEQRLIRQCEAVLAPAQIEMSRMQALCGEHTDHIHFIGCGVDLERFRPLAEEQSRRPGAKPAEPAQLLFVGRFDAMKGLEELFTSITLLPRLPGARLTLVGGDGADSAVQQRLVQLAGDLGLSEQVEFAGKVPHERLPEYYNRADVVVLPSRYESFGLVTLEALACGTLVVATRTGVAAEIISPGVNGYLAEVNNPASLAAAISAAVDLSGSCDAQLIRSTVAGFSWQRVARDLLQVYFQTLTIHSPGFTEQESI
jgi:D-inositol-3-phosphate glycosyltransferase